MCGFLFLINLTYHIQYVRYGVFLDQLKVQHPSRCASADPRPPKPMMFNLLRAPERVSLKHSQKKHPFVQCPKFLGVKNAPGAFPRLQKEYPKQPI